MIKREDVSFQNGLPIAVRTYQIERYIPHWHDDCLEVVFVLSGEAHVLASYDRFHMQKGDFVVLNQEDTHYIQGDENAVIISIYLDLTCFERRYPYCLYQNFICESFNVNQMQAAYLPELRKIFAAIVMKAADPEQNRSSLIEAAERIMEILTGKFDLAYYHNGREIPENQMQRYYRMVKEIEEHYSEKVDLENLAQKEFIGKNYISQFWKQMTNMNFTEYLNSRRCEKAEKMLLTEDMSIYEISLECGFSDPKYIYKNFRKWYETTPSAHKKIYAGYLKRGSSLQEYETADFLERFSRELVETCMEESNAQLLRSAEQAKSWRKKYEVQLQKYTGSKIRREMIRESYQDSGLREIYLPLLDQETVSVQGGSMEIDMEFIRRTIDMVREMMGTLFIEVAFGERSAAEWEQILTTFSDRLQEYAGKEMLNRCRLVICVEAFEQVLEARELQEQIAERTGFKNLKLVFRLH